MTETTELYDNLPELIKAALDVAATGLPVFPTNDKTPCWSNIELGVPRGEGGYKIASTDPARVIELFSHRRAKEIAVPMGEMSGLMCVDVDLQKGDHVHQWARRQRLVAARDEGAIRRAAEDCTFYLNISPACAFRRSSHPA